MTERDNIRYAQVASEKLTFTSDTYCMLWTGLTVLTVQALLFAYFNLCQYNICPDDTVFKGISLCSVNPLEVPMNGTCQDGSIPYWVYACEKESTTIGSYYSCIDRVIMGHVGFMVLFYPNWLFLFLKVTFG